MEVILFDGSGNQLSRVRKWEKLRFRQAASGAGDIELVTDAAIPNLEHGRYILARYLDEDVFTGRIDWAIQSWDASGEGSEAVTVRGPSMEALPPRVIERPEGEAEATHTGYADDAMKAFVRECYESGYASASRAMDGFSVEADDSEYPQAKTLAGEYRDQLPDKLDEWGRAYDVDWWVEADFEAQTFTFRTAYPRRGSDKTNLVFTVSRRNIQSLEYTKDTHDQRNVAYVGGPGEGAHQTVSEVYDGDEPTGWDRREAFVGAPDARYTDDLDMVGGAYLATFGEPVESVTFGYVPKDGCRWLDDFVVGDLVTVYDATFGVSVEAKIEEIEVEVLQAHPELVMDISIKVGKDQVSRWDRFEQKIGPFAKFDNETAPSVPTNLSHDT